MNKKNLLILAAAVVSFAACSDDIAETPPVVTNTPQETLEAPIVFGSLSKGTTRADITGADAAALLGGQFVVSGYKGLKTGEPGTIVFDNYAVRYTENTAYTTESNTRNWEYVGVDRIKHAIDNGITRQAAKYWDYTQSQYDFIAWSTGTKTAIYEGTPADGEVLVSAITPATATGTATGTKAYTFTGSADDLVGCYIADIVTVKKAQYGDDPVTLRFRQLGTKVRIGIYETIPGYSVKDVKFYTKGGLLEATTAGDDDTPGVVKDGQIVEDATLFSASPDIYHQGTFTVTYPTVDDPTSENNNQAHVSFSGEAADQKTVMEWSGLNYTIAEDGEKNGTKFLGRSSSTASMAGDASKNYYALFLPNEIGTNLNLRVDYTLESIDGSGEEIKVKNAKAQVPSIYAQWKSGFAYTYLFKISDKTNGLTGVYDPTQADDATINSDPAGLYPITFDAVVVDAEETDQTQETITLVSTPSITTYQQKSTVVNANEYTVNGQDIFVTVNEDDALVAMTNTDPVTDKDAALYTIPAGKTEAEIVDAMQMQDDDADEHTVKGRNGLVLTEADFTLTNSVEFGADGNAISVADNQAVRFTPTAATTYAFVYTKKAPTTTEDFYQPVTKTKGESVDGLYRWGLKNAPAGDVKKGVKYFTGANTDVLTVFLGQTVNNLYLDDAGNTIASGYAVTGTDYYYTIDKGMHYIKATNIPYASFAEATNLYTFDGTTYTVKPTSVKTPDDGTAYYQKTTEGGVDKYTYCVILPQRTESPVQLKIFKTAADNLARVKCADTDVAYDGWEYFDKFSKNDGEYYTKVIKVQ